MTLGEKLAELRKEKNITQEQMAEELGVTRQTISKWELDQSKPDLQYIRDLSDFFQVTTDYLIKDAIVIEKIPQTETFLNPPIKEPVKSKNTNQHFREKQIAYWILIPLFVLLILFHIFLSYVLLEHMYMNGRFGWYREHHDYIGLFFQTVPYLLPIPFYLLAFIFILKKRYSYALISLIIPFWSVIAQSIHHYFEFSSFYYENTIINKALMLILTIHMTAVSVILFFISQKRITTSVGLLMIIFPLMLHLICFILSNWGFLIYFDRIFFIFPYSLSAITTAIMQLKVSDKEN